MLPFLLSQYFKKRYVYIYLSTRLYFSTERITYQQSDSSFQRIHLDRSRRIRLSYSCIFLHFCRAPKHTRPPLCETLPPDINNLSTVHFISYGKL